jgi:FtsP/CotA-like multicopper oxidase with cupredoxin domain
MDFRGALKLDVPLDPAADRNRLATPGARAPNPPRPQDARPIWRAFAKVHPSPPLFRIQRGRTMMLGLRNSTSSPVSVHVHGHAFRLLDALDDGWKPFWLDTVPIGAGRAERIAFVADNPGKWLLSVTSADGRDGGFGAWFEVN